MHHPPVLERVLRIPREKLLERDRAVVMPVVLIQPIKELVVNTPDLLFRQRLAGVEGVVQIHRQINHLLGVQPALSVHVVMLKLLACLRLVDSTPHSSVRGRDRLEGASSCSRSLSAS
eukprot:978158-Rhodomonas_salina.1